MCLSVFSCCYSVLHRMFCCICTVDASLQKAQMASCELQHTCFCLMESYSNGMLFTAVLVHSAAHLPVWFKHTPLWETACTLWWSVHLSAECVTLTVLAPFLSSALFLDILLRGTFHSCTHTHAHTHTQTRVHVHTHKHLCVHMHT